MVIRKWTFGFEDEEGIVHEDADYNLMFIGNDEEAIDEGKRRSNVWERKNGEFCFKIIRISQGVMKGQKATLDSIGVPIDTVA